MQFVGNHLEETRISERMQTNEDFFRNATLEISFGALKVIPALSKTIQKFKLTFRFIKKIGE